MPDYDTEEPKQSKYNAAFAQLYRLDNLWQSAHFHSRTGQLIKWNWDLDKVWAELASNSKPINFKEMREITIKIAKVKNRNRLYAILLEKEIFLRTIQDKQGKGTAYDDGSEDDWD